MAFLCCGKCTWERARIQLLIWSTLLAFAFSVLTLDSCRFVEVGFETQKQALGLYKFSYRYATCISYDMIDNLVDVNFEPPTKVARAFGVIAAVAGGLVVLMIMIINCIRLHPETLHTWWKITGLLCLTAVIGQGFTFFFYMQIQDSWCYRDGIDCFLGIGGILSAVACCLYLLCCIIFFVIVRVPPSGDTNLYWYDSDQFHQMTSSLGEFTGIHLKRTSCTHNVRALSLIQIIVLVVSVVTWIFSSSAVLDCRFVTVDADVLVVSSDIGLFGYYYDPHDECKYYEQDDNKNMNSASRAAQVFAGIASIFSFILILALFAAAFFWNFPSRFYTAIVPGLFFLCAVSQSLTFLVFVELKETWCDTQGQYCSLAADGIMSVMATCLFLLLTVVTAFFQGVAQPNTDELPVSARHHDSEETPLSSEQGGAKQAEDTENAISTKSDNKNL